MLKKVLNSHLIIIILPDNIIYFNKKVRESKHLFLPDSLFIDLRHY